MSYTSAAVLAGLSLLSASAVGSETFLVENRVENRHGYNSWPMIEAVGNTLVCTYSRGWGHDIDDLWRSAYARTSADGGRTWTPEVCFAKDNSVCEVMIGKGRDSGGAALFWVRCRGKGKVASHHDLYRTMDGVTFEKIATPALKPFPMQITDIVATPSGLMCLWFATCYCDNDGSSWGTLTSGDDGHTWNQRTVEVVSRKADLPTEPSAVCLPDGRLFAIARTEITSGPDAAQFQLTSNDGGATWTKRRTNIRDIFYSTPSLVHDRRTGLVSNYYYQRNKDVLKRRVARMDSIFDHPSDWPEPEVLAHGKSKRPPDCGNANTAVIGDMHYTAYYTGSPSNTAVVVTTARAPGFCAADK